MNFRDFFKDRTNTGFPVFVDGGMGTMIQASGITDYSLPEELNFSHADTITAIHRAYLEAGANIITTNTFGCNSIKMRGCRFCAEKTAETAVCLAKKAITEFIAASTRPVVSDSQVPELQALLPKFVAFDIGPTGHLLEPMGDVSFDDAYRSFSSAAIAAEKAGADLAIIETMSDLYEMKAAILAVRENTSLPVFASMTYQPDLHTLTGADVLTAVTYIEALRPDAAGFNCGGTLEEAAELIQTYTADASIPVLVQPNAGLPVSENGKTVFKVTPDDFADAQLRHYQAGATVLGGCCGTTPAHIAAMISKIHAIAENPETRPIPAYMANREQRTVRETRVCSYSKTAVIGNISGGSGPVIIGERINPTGKKKCKEALLSGDMQFITNEAELQKAAGAHILDVNTGLPGIDEKNVMLNTVRTIQHSFDIPLQIDSSEPDVLESAMRYYNGKALVNSVNGKQHVMDAVFPLIARYGGCVVGLCLDENGIPPDATGRLAIAQKIIREAASYGIPAHDILIDTLTLTVSSQQKEALETARAIDQLKKSANPEFAGVKTVLGVSNISFGLPRREIINSYFFSMALYAGLDACIINPLSTDMMNAFMSYRALAAFDTDCTAYIDAYSGTSAMAPQAVTRQSVSSVPVSPVGEQTVTVPEAVLSVSAPPIPDKKSGEPVPESTVDPVPGSLQDIIIRGYRDRAAAAAELLFDDEALSPLEIINKHIVPALDIVGRDYEKGRKFLPQLLASADTVSRAFEVIKARLAATGRRQAEKGTVLIATVHGDIHDIGKNIVKAMLENYGYTVVDLGKDVPPEVIVERAVNDRIPLIALSALMTTTVMSMEKTIKLLRDAEKRSDMKFTIMVGGAVLTPEYAEKIGADYYGRDAMATVNITRNFYCN